MIKTLIIEDEAKSRQLLNTMIDKYCKKDIEVIATAANVQLALEAINKYQPELIFLDITMPDGTGFDLIEKVSPVNFDIIFTTATDKYAIKAIKYAALDYLLKPIDIDELKNAVKKMVQKQSNLTTVENLKQLVQNLKETTTNFPKITLPTGTAYELVYTKDIIRCEADGSYTMFFLTGDKKFIVTYGLLHYEELLAEKGFIRIHRHHLVNINFVASYLKEGFAIMRDGIKLEVARRKKDELLEALKNV